MRNVFLKGVFAGFQRVLVVAVVCACVSACEQDGPVVQGEGMPLSFVTLSKNIKSDSRAAYSGVFGTTVYYANELSEITNQNKHTKIWADLDNVAVSNHNGIWTTDQTKYWPSAGGIFVAAYSPYDAGTTGGTTTSSRVQMPYNMNTPYVYGVTENKQKDLLFADVQWLPVKTSSSSAVPVMFNHALAMVSVNIKLSTQGVGDDSWKLTLKKVELLNVNKKGSVEIRNNGNNGWSTNNDGAWNVVDGTYETFVKTVNTQLTSSQTKVFENLIVIPQKLRPSSHAASQTVKITYDLETTRKYIDNEGKEQVVVEVKKDMFHAIPLQTKEIAIWKMGQRLTYNITFNSGAEIEFEGGANAWEDEMTVDKAINGRNV